MPTDVVMPQMGESIAEGTIVRWIKKVGDSVDRDEPLFEISTDKVDAEIPSPVAGVITEIRAKEGETVPVNSVVAVIGAAGARPAATPAAAPQPVSTPSAPAPAVSAPKASPQADGAPSATSAPAPAPAPRAASPAVPSSASSLPAPTAAGGPRRDESVGDAIRQRSSPLVRKIAKEHNIDITQIRGTGIGGRVTRDDILAVVGPSDAVVAATPGGSAAAPQAPRTATPPSTSAAGGAGLAGQSVPMSVMRRRIAEHMIASRRTSAHVHSVFEVNFARVDRVRQVKKAEYERAGAKLTYMAFILKAVVDALRAVPVVNASVDGENIVYHKQINIGIAVALDWGLIVPVVKGADEKNVLGLSRAIVDLANRARAKQLK